MEYKTLGIIAIIVFATTSAFMADGDDIVTESPVEYEEIEYDYDDMDEFYDEEYWDDDNIEYVTVEEVSVDQPVIETVSVETVTVAETEKKEPPVQEQTQSAVTPRSLAARMTCAEINAKIAELREDVKSYPELKSDLQYMIGRQRTQCATTVGRRPVRNYDNVNPVKVIDVPTPEPAVVEIPVPEPVQEPVTEKTPEELAAEEEAKNAKIIENLNNGLCADGMRPNRYGCCGDEVFKEVMPLIFACCPKDGVGQCLEPIK